MNEWLDLGNETVLFRTGLVGGGKIDEFLVVCSAIELDPQAERHPMVSMLAKYNLIRYYLAELM